MLERRYWAAVLGKDNMNCGNVELHMSKASENGDLLIGEDKRLLTYETELIPVYKLSKKKKDSKSTQNYLQKLKLSMHLKIICIKNQCIKNLQPRKLCCIQKTLR